MQVEGEGLHIIFICTIRKPNNTFCCTSPHKIQGPEPFNVDYF